MNLDLKNTGHRRSAQLLSGYRCIRPARNLQSICRTPCTARQHPASPQDSSTSSSVTSPGKVVVIGMHAVRADLAPRTLRNESQSFPRGARKIGVPCGSLWFRAGNTARLPFRRRGVGLIYRGPCFLNPNSCSGDPSFNRVRHNTVMMLRSLNAADTALSWAALILVVIAALSSL